MTKKQREEVVEDKAMYEELKAVLQAGDSAQPDSRTSMANPREGAG